MIRVQLDICEEECGRVWGMRRFGIMARILKETLKLWNLETVGLWNFEAATPLHLAGVNPGAVGPIPPIREWHEVSWANS